MFSHFVPSDRTMNYFTTPIRFDGLMFVLVLKGQLDVEINLENGHKYALYDIAKGENIIKYGQPIGHATKDLKKGDHVHSHNMKTNLSDNLCLFIAVTFGLIT